MLVIGLLVIILATARASVLTPPVLPLLVRNPYLSVWLGDAREPPWDHWPIFWTGQSLGFSAMAFVPGSHKVYPLLGRPQDSLRGSHRPLDVAEPEYLGSQYDASTTNLTYAIPSPVDGGDPATLVLSFLSPITPGSTLRQSLPAAYLAVTLQANFAVTFYVDINGIWASGTADSEIMWHLGRQDAITSARGGVPLKTWKLSKRSEQPLSEYWDRAEWGTLHFSGPASASHQCGSAMILRHQFATHGNLTNEEDMRFRKINDHEPAFAFAKTFRLGDEPSLRGSVRTEEALFTFALAQDPVVQYASARGLTMMRPLWSPYFATDDDMIRYHYDDFFAASVLAGKYSRQLAADASASGSEHYGDIVALSARQVLGATQFSGTPENPLLFLKEISSNGNFQTVDVIFPAFPFFLYTNPRWLGYLLEPLLEHMLSGQYPNNYSMHDLGSHYPNATGHPDGQDEYMPVEECGNMLIMGLARANVYKYKSRPASHPLSVNVDMSQATAPLENDRRVLSFDNPGSELDEDSETVDLTQGESWLSKHYQLWEQWAGYLVRESLIPANQLSTDDFAGWLANQTNLALKGIIGIKAMSEIARILGKDNDSKHYSRIAEEYIDKWHGFAFSRDGSHAKLAYTWYGSWTTIYNLFADSLLCFRVPKSQPKSAPARQSFGDQQIISGAPSKSRLEFVPSRVYQSESKWYSAVLQTYGLPLDSRHLYTKSDWEFFAAAVASNQTRYDIVRSIAKWVNETTTDRPLTDLYETETGGWPGPHFKARPVVGGHFAILALERACGGKAMEYLPFSDEPGISAEVDVVQALRADMIDGRDA